MTRHCKAVLWLCKYSNDGRAKSIRNKYFYCITWELQTFVIRNCILIMYNDQCATFHCKIVQRVIEILRTGLGFETNELSIFLQYEISLSPVFNVFPWKASMSILFHHAFCARITSFEQPTLLHNIASRRRWCRRWHSVTLVCHGLLTWSCNCKQWSLRSYQISMLHKSARNTENTFKCPIWP